MTLLHQPIVVSSINDHCEVSMVISSFITLALPDFMFFVNAIASITYKINNFTMKTYYESRFLCSYTYAGGCLEKLSFIITCYCY